MEPRSVAWEYSSIIMIQEDEMEQCGGSSAIQKIRCEFEANLDHTVRETGVKIPKMCEFEKLQTPSP